MHKDSSKYYINGIAELVDQPSLTTLHLFNHWFTGNRSLGTAMKKLRLPYNKVNLEIFEIHDGHLVVNANNEEKTLYSNTVFKYDIDPNQQLQIKFNLAKIFNFQALGNSIKILSLQTKILSGRSSIDICDRLVREIPIATNYKTAKECAKYLETHVWPQVIGIAYINDFYSSYLQKKHKQDFTKILQHINPYLVKDDWLFRALDAKQKAASKLADYQSFIDEFGTMADDPYEITCPRWHEIPKTKLLNIKSGKTAESKNSKQSLTSEEEILRDLMLIRTEAKRKTLIHLDKLRFLYGLNNISTEKKEIKRKRTGASLSNGSGRGVSQGTVSGPIIYVDSVNMKIPKGSLGIFPNAGPLLSHRYRECVGIIFLSGGIMSHGSILARELEIPAIIDPNAAGITNTVKIEIDGTTGKWTKI